MSLPHIREQAVDAQGRPTAPFYRWYRRVEDALASVVSATPADTSNFLTKATTATAGEGIDIAGSLSGGAIEVSLAELADSGSGASLVKITRDAYGRVEGSEAAALDDLSDVDTTGAASGDVLTYGGGGWTPATPSGGGASLPATYGSYLAASLEPDALEALQYNAFSYPINSTTTKLLLASWQTQLGASGRFEQRNPQRFMPLRGVTLSGTGTGSAAILLDPAAATYADPWNTYYTRLGDLQALATKHIPVTGASTVVPLLPGPYGSILTHVTCFNLAWLSLRWSGSSIGINLWDEVSDATTQRMGDSLLLPLSKKVASEVESSTTSSSTGGSASGAVCLVDLPSTWSEIADPLETAYGVPTFRDDFMGTTLDTTVWTRAQAVAGNVEIDTTRPWLKFVGSSSWGANGLYKTTKQARSNGRKLIVDHYTGRNTSAQGTGMFGWSDGLGQSYSNFAHAINFAGSGGTLNIYENGTLRGTVGSGWTEGTIYRLYIEQTTTGAIYKIQGGTQYPAIGSASWTTLTPGTSSSSTATLTPGATAWFGTSYVSDFRVYG